MNYVLRFESAELPVDALDLSVPDQLISKNGLSGFHEVVDDSSFLLADLLGHLDVALSKQNFTQCYRLAAEVRSVAENLGMTAVSRVSEDVMRCAQSAEKTALAAVIARLDRITESTLPLIYSLGA